MHFLFSNWTRPFQNFIDNIVITFFLSVLQKIELRVHNVSNFSWFFICELHNMYKLIKK